MSQVIAQHFRQLWEMEYNQTQAVIAVLPDDQMGYAPFPGARTVRELALHIIGIEEHLIRGVKRGELLAGGNRNDLPELQTAAAIAAHYQAQHEALRPIAAEFDDEFLARTVTLKRPTGEVIRAMPATDFLPWALLHHLVHHRAQLLIYLRLLGVKIPGIYGPTRENTPGAAG